MNFEIHRWKIDKAFKELRDDFAASSLLGTDTLVL